MSLVSTIELLQKLIDGDIRLKNSNSIPDESNYEIEFVFEKDCLVGRVVNIGTFAPSKITVASHLRLKGLTRDCYLKFSDANIKKTFSI